VVAKDDLTVEIRFAQPTPYPYIPFVSSTTPILQEKQFKDCMGARIASCTAQNFGPIGTGPYVVKEFKPTKDLGHGPHSRMRVMAKSSRLELLHDIRPRAIGPKFCAVQEAILAPMQSLNCFSCRIGVVELTKEYRDRGSAGRTGSRPSDRPSRPHP